ncbi:MAG TPA: GyrI-like domain-containing protein [Aequorivita sp.]|nr:GyrI-like domain-containing protein [Aequorivita sp.]
MKILKYLLFLILLVFIGSAIYFGTKESSYKVQDSLIILAPTEVVYNKVNDLKSWEEWDLWENENPNSTLTYAEKSMGEGASFSWSGKQNGSITTLKVIPNKEIEQELTINTSRGERNAKIYWKFDEIDGNTDVTWTVEGEHSLVDKIFLSLSDEDFNTKIHQKKQAALENIATIVADDMKRYSINVDGVTQYGGGYYMYTTSVAKKGELREKMNPMMDEVKRFIARNNLKPSGKPFLLYNSIDENNNTVIFSTCVPLKEHVITTENSNIVSGFMEAGTTVKVSLKGNYENFEEAYEKARKYMVANQYQKDSSRNTFEVYVTDPKEVANPVDWLTEIYIPIINSPEPEFQGI